MVRYRPSVDAKEASLVVLGYMEPIHGSSMSRSSTEIVFLETTTAGRSFSGPARVIACLGLHRVGVLHVVALFGHVGLISGPPAWLAEGQARASAGC